MDQKGLTYPRMQSKAKKYKICSQCKQKLPISNFSFKIKNENKKQSYCKSCQASYSKKHYSLNKEEYIIRGRNYKNKIRAELKIKLLDYLSVHPCVDCGESNPTILTFDHIKDNKKACISDLIRNRVSWKKIMLEIKKCEVRCFNCHMKITAKRAGWEKPLKNRYK